MPLGYELVADSDPLTSAVTQYDFTGLNFTSDDELILVCDFKNNLSGFVDYALYLNNDLTDSNYYLQYLLANSSSVSSGRYNTNAVAGANPAGDNSTAIIRCKLTESGYGNIISNELRNYTETSAMRSQTAINTTLFIMTSITQMTIKAKTSGGIAAGSRFKLYKLIAEPLADITVTSDTTQVDITDLNLDETNELLLVSDIQNGTASSANIELFFNNDTTSTNYYKQELSADSTTISGGRTNDAIITRLDATNGDTVCMTSIKLTNSGYPTAQGKSIREVGTSGVNLINDYLSKAGTVTSITDISLVASVTGAIGTGSRFKLYKLK